MLSHLSAEEIFQEVQQLPDGYRTIFNLYVVEGFNHNEIADLLKITPSSSRSQLTRAKNALRNVIKKKTKLISYGTAK